MLRMVSNRAEERGLIEVAPALITELFAGKSMFPQRDRGVAKVAITQVVVLPVGSEKVNPAQIYSDRYRTIILCGSPIQVRSTSDQ